MLFKDVAYFIRLHAYATYLDLPVFAALVIEEAILTYMGQVAGGEPCRAGTECLQCRKFAEALAGHVFVIVVACGKAGPGNKNLSLFPAWQGASVFIHDGDKGVRNGLADGDRVAQATGSGSFMPGRVRRHFCRAVEVQEAHFRNLGEYAFHQPR